MSEQALRQPNAEAWELRVLGEEERIYRAAGAERRRGDTLANGGKREEWAASLALVEEACETIRLSEQRIEELERELEQTVIQSRDNLKQMLKRIEASQEETQAASMRAQAAEARAAEAEEWLARLNSAIVKGFGSAMAVTNTQTEAPAKQTA